MQSLDVSMSTNADNMNRTTTPRCRLSTHVYCISKQQNILALPREILHRQAHNGETEELTKKERELVESMSYSLLYPMS